jgi:hypothetical protein
MSISELMYVSERARRIEVFTGAGRRRTWPADEKAAIVAESYAPGRTVCGVARRHGLTPAQLLPGAGSPTAPGCLSKSRRRDHEPGCGSCSPRTGPSSDRSALGASREQARELVRPVPSPLASRDAARKGSGALRVRPQ